MNQNALSVLFYLNKSKTNKEGLCPIRCRITYLKRRKEFATGEFIKADNWLSKKQRTTKSNQTNLQTDLQLEIIKSNIKRSFLELQVSQNNFGVEDIFKIYIGETANHEKYTIEYLNEFLNKKQKLIGIDLQLSTWKKFYYAKSQFGEFIKWKFNKKDIRLDQLKIQVLKDFEFYLKTVRHQKQITINKCVQRLRKPIREAVNEGFLDKDPFTSHKPGKVSKEVIFLSVDELKSLEAFRIKQPRLQLVRDLFVFCCYTGLAYNEMNRLEDKHIVNGFDGNQWIQMKRKKTNKSISVPLLPKAKDILKKYREVKSTLLPRMSNQKINSYLKEIAEIVGINKAITHHMARKTFASTVLLYNDVPIEIVSELLGHSNIKITQDYYGKVVQRRISEEIKQLKRKLK
ncbi:site-specific integrase [Maribacter algicola]|uniref:Site-specific integrase n=1 Tax=Maribacter algicola TaxID=2498892 RepID=A0A426RLF5_9FLAO|nr:site-specific integrase [Maribacter algicola]RRQ49823.1 site-specific integrase [Maribacter algicola]